MLLLEELEAVAPKLAIRRREESFSVSDLRLLESASEAYLGEQGSLNPPV